MRTKKFHGTKFLGLLGIIVLALVFLGIDDSQAQVKVNKGKPPEKGKPPKLDEKWTVELPNISEAEMNGYNLYGMNNHIYESNDYVTVELTKTDLKKCCKSEGFSYGFYFRVAGNNDDEWVGVRNISALNITSWDQSLISCFFPYDCSLDIPPYCIECFLNRRHPGNYIHVLMRFGGFINFDPRNMDVGQSVEDDNFSFDIWNSDQGDPNEWHSLITDWTKNPSHGEFKLTKTGEEEWLLEVKEADFYAHEFYMNYINKGRRGIRIPVELEKLRSVNLKMTWKRQVL